MTHFIPMETDNWGDQVLSSCNMFNKTIDDFYEVKNATQCVNGWDYFPDEEGFKSMATEV